jgi:predicted dehydrogenase
MVRVGVVGLGMMGLTHLDVYRTLSNVKIAAICDADAKRLSGEVHAAGNIEGQSQISVAHLPGDVRRCADIGDVIGAKDIDLVDICLPTDMHMRFGVQALEAGQHVLIEKPLARTSEQAARLISAAENAKGMAFVGHCLRFWPGWSWLKDAVSDGRYGKVLSASFRRVVNHPGGPFYTNGDRSGGAALDLHIHDTDFVQYLFGMPKAVTSFGYSKITNQPDHIITSYEYDDVPLVVAEGSWAMADGFIFNMGFTVNFERATAEYDSALPQPLKLFENGKANTIELTSTMGYNFEIEYYIDCIEKQTPSTTVTLRDGLNTIKIIEAEVASLRSGRKVSI